MGAQNCAPVPHPAILLPGRTLSPFLATPDPISVFTQGWELGWLQAQDKAYPRVRVPLPFPTVMGPLGAGLVSALL